MTASGNIDNSGCGRPWNHYPTEFICIPSCFKEQILAFARSLDEGVIVNKDTDVNLVVKTEENSNENQLNKDSAATIEIRENQVFTEKDPEFYSPLVEFYNQNKPKTWASCEKINKQRLNGLKALYKEWGEETLSAMSEALAYINQDQWWREKCNSRCIDTFLRRGKVTELRDKYKVSHSNFTPVIVDNNTLLDSEEKLRIYNALQK